MEAMEMLVNRRSIRKFKDEMIPQEVLDKILEAGTYAPTGRGAQAPIMICVKNKEVRDDLSSLNASVMGATNDPFYGAPVVVLVLANKETKTYVYDGSCVMTNLLNAAYANGIGSCWIHRCKEMFESAKGKEYLAKWNIEGDYEGVGCCILGYADATPSPAPRKDNYITIIE